MSPAVEVWTPNHWTAKEFPDAAVLNRVHKVGLTEKVTESGLKDLRTPALHFSGGRACHGEGPVSAKTLRKNQ